MLSTGNWGFSTGLKGFFHRAMRIHWDLLISWGLLTALRRTGLFSEFMLSSVTKIRLKPLFSRELIQS